MLSPLDFSFSINWLSNIIFRNRTAAVFAFAFLIFSFFFPTDFVDAKDKNVVADGTQSGVSFRGDFRDCAGAVRARAGTLRECMLFGPYIRGHVHMTSAKFWRFLTPPPHPQFTQPISTVCTQNWAILEPHSPVQTSYVHGP